MSPLPFFGMVNIRGMSFSRECHFRGVIECYHDIVMANVCGNDMFRQNKLAKHSTLNIQYFFLPENRPELLNVQCSMFNGSLSLMKRYPME